MDKSIFIIIVAIVVFDFIFEQLLNYLNTTRWTSKLPEELGDIYNNEEYTKSQAYKKANHKFGMITSTFSFVLILLMLLLGGFALVDSWVSQYTQNSIITALLFFAIIGLASDLLSTPFDIYDTFVIEERFGFNKITPKLFVFDKIKGLLLSALLGAGIISLLIWLFNIMGNYFWVIAWGAVTIISIFFALFYSNLIVPLFNKQTPLDDGELKQSIEAFAHKVGFKLTNIYVIDGSKRSTKANAYFTGLGAKKRIVLYDTLIADLTVNEVVAVLAHEIGHYKKHHVIWGLLLGILQTGLMLFLFSLFVQSENLSLALGVHVPKFHIGLIAFGILYSPLSFLIGIIMNVFSRKNEYQADAFANSFDLGNELVTALKKLSLKSLSNLTPHPWYVFFHYSHPTLLQRIKKIKYFIVNKL
ncbi:MAG TPA: M48 family metallopeptidase [Prolixibacteraceae bacterium]|nr:M48 family metallopeptidase [Prolixibacteraceae bacterium]